MVMLIIVTLIFIVLSLIFIGASYLTVRTFASSNQDMFLKGKVPDKLPEGLFRGEVPGHKFSWQGKKFSAQNKRGINIFKNGELITENYPFKFYQAKGLQDNNEVIRIDYNLPENPLWLRFIVDEIVETSPNKYLGKLHVRLFPGLVASLGYFKLEK